MAVALSEYETIVDLIRHGEPVGGRRYRGHGVDDPLSETGWQQMWSSVGSHPPWSQVISSPMQRCCAFAQALGECHQLPVRLDKGFREVGFGVWEGHSGSELKRDRPREYAAFYTDPVGNRPPGAEPLDSFVARVRESYDAAVDGAQGEHLLIVTHAGVIRAIIASILGTPLQGMYRIRVTNAGITRIRQDSFGANLECLNSASVDTLDAI